MLCTFTFSFDHFPLTNPVPPKLATATTAAIVPENAGYACQGVVCVLAHANNDTTRFPVVAVCKSLCFEIGNPWSAKCTWMMCGACPACSGA